MTLLPLNLFLEYIFRNMSLACLWLQAHAMYPFHTCRMLNIIFAILDRLGRDPDFGVIYIGRPKGF
jgi:hypothetical protein